MLEDPCPKCGHRRKRTLMSTNHAYDDITLTDMWHGRGEWWQQILLRIMVYFLVFIAICQIMIATR